MDSERSDPIIREQIDYYRARAAEYDDWYHRRGRYDHGKELNDRFKAELKVIETELRPFTHADRVLELAAGTGWWTRFFLEAGAKVTAVDASSEVLALNQRRNGNRNINYIEADLLSWRPVERYDVVFFAFWLSHVPPAQFESFWKIVEQSLKPGGKVFFADTLRHGIKTVGARDHHRQDDEGHITERYLNDGASFNIYKVFYEPKELKDRLRSLGWRVDVRTTGAYFLFGFGGKRETETP